MIAAAEPRCDTCGRLFADLPPEDVLLVVGWYGLHLQHNDPLCLPSSGAAQPDSIEPCPA